MAFIVNSSNLLNKAFSKKVETYQILDENNVQDKRVFLNQIDVPTGSSYQISAPKNGLIWFHVIQGELKNKEQILTKNEMTLLTASHTIEVIAQTDSRLILGTISEASIYEKDFTEKVKPYISFDWSREPVLRAEHDTRERIYLASKGLINTEVLKGEMIKYPSGASGGAHHHQGAHHFQYVLNGSGIAVLEGKEFELKTGDVLFNLENEVHWFYNKEQEDFIFVEFFVPGESKTVWQPDANVCGWLPTGKDSSGNTSVRELQYHIHGQGDV